MSAPKGADITDAATRSALVLLFKQLVLATPKTRSLTITIGDIKITSPPVQHTHWQAARGQPDPRRFSSEQQQRHRVPNAEQRRSANRAAERAGQPPPYPKPSMAKEEQAAHPGMPAPAAPPPAQPAAPPPAQPAPDRGAPPPPQQLEAKGHEGLLPAQPAQVAASMQAPPPTTAAAAEPPPDISMDDERTAHELPTDATAAAEAAPAAPVAAAKADTAGLSPDIEPPARRRLEPSLDAAAAPPAAPSTNPPGAESAPLAFPAEPPAIAPQVHAPALPEAGTAPPPQATAFDYAAHALARAAAHEPTANPAPASTGQPEKGGDELIAAARDSLPLRGATQLRRGTKHHTPPRSSRRPTSEPDAPPSSARPKKGARKQLALAAVLAARPPRRPVSALLFYAAEHRARIKMEAPHLEEMEGVRAEFEALDAEGLAKYEALVQQDVERFRRECEERGIDPDELMSRPARRPDELRR